MSEQYQNASITKILTNVIAISFFGFIGVECATAPAGSVENPSKTIPRAIIIGTFCVALVYFINNLAIMGVIPRNELANSAAPFVDAIDRVCGKDISKLISVITAIVIVGTLNAWIITSSQILLVLSESGFMPKFLAMKNKAGSPYVSVIINCFAMIPILALTKISSISTQVMNIIDFSVITFLFVYAICTMAFIKMFGTSIKMILFGFATLFFCILIIIESSISAILCSAIMVLIGAIILPFLNKKNYRN